MTTSLFEVKRARRFRRMLYSMQQRHQIERQQASAQETARRDAAQQTQQMYQDEASQHLESSFRAITNGDKKAAQAHAAQADEAQVAAKKAAEEEEKRRQAQAALDAAAEQKRKEDEELLKKKIKDNEGQYIPDEETGNDGPLPGYDPTLILEGDPDQLLDNLLEEDRDMIAELKKDLDQKFKQRFG